MATHILIYITPLVYRGQLLLFTLYQRRWKTQEERILVSFSPWLFHYFSITTTIYGRDSFVIDAAIMEMAAVDREFICGGYRGDGGSSGGACNWIQYYGMTWKVWMDMVMGVLV